jgi:chromo domain-containing protein 1
VFEQKPQLALQIMKHFFAKIEKLRQLEGPVSPWQEVVDASLLWRLCVRPELMEYLYARCEEQSSELDAGDPDATARATLYTLLCETNYIEQDHPVLPLSANSDRYPIMSERRIIAEGQPLDYFAIAARDPKEATRRMIRYYAGLQVDMRRDYRHFYVVHTEPFATCVRTWKQDVQTIADVIDPERCVAELSTIMVKGDGKSLFDFHERHMPALNSLSIADTSVGQVAQVQREQVTDSQMSMEDGEVRLSIEEGGLVP